LKNKDDFLGLPYWKGAVLLGLLNTAVFFVSSKPWGITTAFSFWGAEGLKMFGFSPEHWKFFVDLRQITKPGYYQPLLYGSAINIGLVLGVLISSLVHREFRIRWPRQRKQYILALLGGILMGYGARLAGGCTVGALVGGTASLSLHGWVFGFFLLPGAWIGIKIVMSRGRGC